MERIMKRTIIGLIIATMLGALNLFGGIAAPQSLLNLEQQSDFIVVGSVTSSSYAGVDLTFTIQVSRVVKGDSALAGHVIPVVWTSSAGRSSVPTGAPVETGSGLWFLQG